MKCYCFHRNAVDVVSGGRTPFAMRYGEDYKGPIIPLGAEIEYRPSSKKDRKRLHKVGSKMLSGVFVGYKQKVGGGWSGELIIADWEEIENADVHSTISKKVFLAQEVYAVKRDDEFVFPMADGILCQPNTAPRERKKQVRKRNKLLESGLVDPLTGHYHSATADSEERRTDESRKREEAIEVFEKREAREDAGVTESSTETQEAENVGSADQPTLTDSDSDAEDSLARIPIVGPTLQAKDVLHDRWIISGSELRRVHRTPRTALFQLTEANAPIALKYVDIFRITETDLTDKHEARIEDFWFEQPIQRLSEPWTGSTKYYIIPRSLENNPDFGPKWEYVSGRPTKIQKTTRPGHVWVEDWNFFGDKEKAKAIAYWTEEKPKRVANRLLRGIEDVIRDSDLEYDGKVAEARRKYGAHEGPKLPMEELVGASATDVISDEGYTSDASTISTRDPGSESDSHIEMTVMGQRIKSRKDTKQDECVQKTSKRRMNRHVNHKDHKKLRKAAEAKACAASEKTNTQQEFDEVMKSFTEPIPMVSNTTHRGHQERESPSGEESEFYMGMVHTPIKIDLAMRIPLAKAAVDKEWNKLETKGAWIYSEVQERSWVVSNRKRPGKKLYFGSVRDLCHQKHSERTDLPAEYKGRVIFQGNMMRDETGFYAIMSEQGTSASHMAGAKILDGLARMPGMTGHDSDARSAYTQVRLAEAARLLPQGTSGPLAGARNTRTQ